ncbi:MAG: methyltransferase domain-containing protein [bacterium]|nr:methyltransferase domain-containing protein [bacterium]
MASESSALTAPSEPGAATVAEDVAILGAGWSTRQFLQTADCRTRACIGVVLDDSPDRRGDQVCGYPVQAPAECSLGHIRSVWITSEMYAAELTSRARQLFGDSVRIEYTFDHASSLPKLLGDAYLAVETAWEQTCAEDALWYSADRLYSSLRTRLDSLSTWRYGPRRQLAEFAEMYAALDGLITWPGARLANIGCGRYHPLGVSLLALLAGAERTSACDVEPLVDPRRAAQAMADLVAETLLDPRALPGDRTASRTALLARIESAVNLEGLRSSDLLQAVNPTLLDYRVESIYESSLPKEDFDVVVSRDVFEHLSDVPQALAAVYDRLSPGGLAVLFIDFSDHRRYQDARTYAHWSHLEDLDQPTHLHTNRLRFSEYPQLFERARLEVVGFEPTQIEPLPADAKMKLALPYRRMSDDDLAVSRARAILRKG